METAGLEELHELVITVPNNCHFSSQWLQIYCVSLEMTGLPVMDVSTPHRTRQGVMRV